MNWIGDFVESGEAAILLGFYLLPYQLKFRIEGAHSPTEQANAAHQICPPTINRGVATLPND